MFSSEATIGLKHHFLKKDIDKFDPLIAGTKINVFMENGYYKTHICQYWHNVCYGDENSHGYDDLPLLRFAMIRYGFSYGFKRL